MARPAAPPVGSPRAGGVDWLGRAVLPAGVALMDLCWLWPWSLLAGQWLWMNEAAALLPAPVMLALLLVSQALMRAAARSRWPLAWSRAGLAGVGLLAVLLLVGLVYFGAAGATGLGWLTLAGAGLVDAILAVSAPAVALGFGLVLWGRGIGHGRADLDAEDVAGVFRQGVIGLIVALIAMVVTEAAASERLLAESSPAALGFVFLGLTMISLAHLAATRARGQGRAGGASTFNRAWLAALTGLMSALALLTLLLAGVISVDLVRTVLRPALDLIGGVARWLVTLIAYPLALAVEYLIEFARQFLRPNEPRPKEESGGAPARPELPEPTTLVVPDEVILIVQWGLVALILTAAVVMLARTIFWSPARQDDHGVEEERESVTDWAAVRAALLAWLRARFGRRDRPAVTPAPPALAPPDEPPGATTIRQVYGRLLQLGAAMGVVRARSTTAAEHLTPLQRRLEPDDDLAWLTDAYMRARYGREAPPETEVAEARARWERIQRDGQPGAPPSTPGRDASA